MNIPDSKDARNMDASAKYEKAQQQIKEVEKLINKAISNGQVSASGDGCLDQSVINKLKEKGYKYSISSQYNESYYIISW